MGYKEEEAKNKGALVSSKSSNKKGERAHRMFLNKFGRACGIVRTMHDPRCKYPWSLVTFASCCVRTESLTSPSSEKNPKELVAGCHSGPVPTISRDFSKSANICDKSAAVRSQGSILVLGASTQPLDNAGESSSNPSSEFVNHGLLVWNQTREQWAADKRKTSKRQRLREPKLSWDDQTYESLLGSNDPFAEPVPLPEMVYLLVDLWEQEGMYNVSHARFQ